MHACEGRERRKKCIHAHNFEIKNITVSNQASKSNSDCTVMFVAIKASKYDLQPLCFNDIFFERKYFFVYSNLLMMFEKNSCGFM